MKILIVEDDPTDMKLLTAVLDAMGHEVHGRRSAEDVAEGIALLQPELILLDLKLPGMNGLAFARLLKQDPATRDIPIVALTAACETFDRDDALAAGCAAFLVKPINTRSISEHVTSLVPNPK